MKKSHNLQLLLVGMGQYIQDHIADRGFAYYEQGLVKNVHIKEPWIQATVPGNYGNYKVRIHLTDFSKSQCNCPYQGYCKHLAAVVYYVTSSTGQLAGLSPEGAPEAADTTSILTKNGEKQPGLQHLLSVMGKNDLLETIYRLVEIQPTTKETFRLILTERERHINLHSDRIRQMDLHSSLAYYQKEFPTVLKQCESMFSIIETSDENYYGYYEDENYDDCGNMANWDYTRGVEILRRYGQELLQMVTAEHYISGTVGLLVVTMALEDWITRYDDEYGENELFEFYSELEDYLWEALERVRDYQSQDPGRQIFLQELIDWIVLQCQGLEDLSAWLPVLHNCIPDQRHLQHLKERIIKLDRDFLQNTQLDDKNHHFTLIIWWVELCLSLGLEEDAKQAAGIVAGLFEPEAAIADCFLRFYERLERWPEAIATMQTIFHSRELAYPDDYQRMINLHKKTGSSRGIKEWYEKWFLSYPCLELFKQNLTLIENEPDKEAQIHRWLEHLEQGGKYFLLISIYLQLLNDVDSAWSMFCDHHKDIVLVEEPVIHQLFQKMKKIAPIQLIPIYIELALDNISIRKRPAYARAARWMKDLKEVCDLSGNEQVWINFYQQILTQYRRFYALMDEIRAVGMG